MAANPDPTVEPRLAQSESFSQINALHSYPSTWAEPVAGGVLQKIAKRLSFWLRSKVLKDYFEKEQAFQLSVVQQLNEISKRVDLIRNLEHDQLSSAILGSELHTKQSVAQLESELSKRLAALDQAKAQLDARLHTVEDVVNGMERLLGVFERSTSTGGVVPEDVRYVLLENRYRGSEEVISERLELYANSYAEWKSLLNGNPVLEIGSGRGELQSLFKQRGIESYGLELDQAMQAICVDKGHDVRLADGIAHLRSLPDASLGGVIAVQVVEHLSFGQRKELLELCAAKVVPGGRVVFETINSESIVALAHNYFRDPTHVWPLLPETMRYAVELSGMKVVDIIRRSPFPAEACLQPLLDDSLLGPRLSLLVTQMNLNVQRLNELLFGYQDYCIIAEPVG